MANEHFPANLVVRGRRVLVVGGGAVAARKIEALLECGADVHVVATVVGDEVRSLGVSFDERAYRRGDLDGCWLAVTATGDPAANQQVFDDAEAARVWVNAADDPARCSVTLPAVIRRGDVVVAVSTGGRSPAVASWLRDRLVPSVPAGIETLVEVVATERDRLRAAGHGTEGLDWRRALDSDMLDLIRAGEIERARERLTSCLSSS